MDFAYSLVDRPPLTEGWHLVVMIAAGAAAVALVHRIVKRKVSIIERNARVRRSSD